MHSSLQALEAIRTYAIFIGLHLRPRHHRPHPALPSPAMNSRHFIAIPLEGTRVG
jgi:hypothetical protein